MSYTVLTVGDDYKDRWDEFVKKHGADGGLLQSWGWGDFQKALDLKIIRLAALDGRGELVAAAQLIRHDLPFEYNYLYCPRGPITNQLKIDSSNVFIDEIKKIGGNEKSFLLRVDPAWLLGTESRLTAAGLRKSDAEVQPKCSLIIDISPDEQVIAAGMKQKTRYNIGLAQRHKISVRVSTEIQDIEIFWQLTKETAGRDGFKPHAKDHYKKLFEVLSRDGTVKLLIAEYDNKAIAASMVSFFGKTATYLHGASSDLYREVMAPYLLQWHGIIEAKRAGCERYDLGGVNGQTFTNKRWQGITRFKTGFSPSILPHEWVGNFEVVLNPVVYSMYKFAKQIRG